MKTFKDLRFNEHPLGGVQVRVQFLNGFGASIVRHEYSYGGNKGLYELAVLDQDGHITYDTLVTNDVLGYLSEADVTDSLQKIQSL